MPLAFILGFHVFLFRVLLFLKFSNQKTTVNDLPEEEIITRQQKFPLFFIAFIGIFIYFIGLESLFGLIAVLPVISAIIHAVFVKKENLEAVNFDGILFLLNVRWKGNSWPRYIDNSLIAAVVVILTIDSLLNYLK
jgi:hypothetical protein